MNFSSLLTEGKDVSVAIEDEYFVYGGHKPGIPHITIKITGVRKGDDNYPTYKFVATPGNKVGEAVFHTIYDIRITPRMKFNLEGKPVDEEDIAKALGTSFLQRKFGVGSRTHIYMYPPVRV